MVVEKRKGERKRPAHDELPANFDPPRLGAAIGRRAESHCGTWTLCAGDSTSGWRGVGVARPALARIARMAGRTLRGAAGEDAAGDEGADVLSTARLRSRITSSLYSRSASFSSTRNSDVLSAARVVSSTSSAKSELFQGR